MTTETRSSPVDRLPVDRVIVGLAAGVLLVHVVVALSHGGPVAVPDIPGYLAVAQWVAGGLPPPEFGYHPGYGLLLAPIALTGISPDGLHTAALLVNGAFAVGAVLIAAALARTLAPNAPRWTPLAAAALAALHPSLSSASRVAWTETLLVFLVLISAYLLARAVTQPPSPARYALFGAAAVIGTAAHPRAAALAAAAVLAAAVARPGWRAAAGFVAGATASAVATLVALAVAYNGPASRGRLSGAVDSAGDGAGLLTTMSGQVAAIAAGTAGLALIGLVEAARRAALGVRRTRPASHDGHALSAVGVLLLLGTLGTLVIAGSSLAGSDRADTFAYGRYLDPYTVALSVFALATLAYRSRDVLASAAIIVVSTTAVVWLSADLAIRPATRLMVMATDQWWILSDGRLVPALLAGSAAALAGLAAFAAAQRWPKAAAVPFVLLLGLATIATITTHRHLAGVGAVSAGQATATPVRDAIAGVDDTIDCVAHDRTDVPTYVMWLYRMQLPDLRHERVDLAQSGDPCSPIVIGHTEEGPLAACEGARLLHTEPMGRWGPWLIPADGCR